MLYCPKCKSTYEDGSQRFCTNDGGRLLPGTSITTPHNQQSASGKGVFSNLIGKNAPSLGSDEKLTPSQRFVKASERVAIPPPRIPGGSKMFREENAPQPDVAKPVVRLVKPNEIPSGTAPTGNRQVGSVAGQAFTSDKADSFIGQTVKGRYSILQKTGQDASSISYLAEDKIIADKKVVVRILLDDKKDDFLSKVLAEERVSLSHLSHPNIAAIIDSGEMTGGISFLITEYIDAFSLQHKLSKLDQFNSLRTARIIKQISYALSEVHQNGILHRSLCPENIFMTISEAGIEQTKVTGFGVSSGKASSQQNLSYVSPEQLEGKSPSFASDIYALAAIAFRMLTGRAPYNVQSPDQLLKAQKAGLSLRPSNLRLDIKPEVDDVLAKAMSYEPSERYGNVREFGDALFNALGGTVSQQPARQTELKPASAEQIRKEIDSEEKIPLPSSSILLSSPKHESTIGDANHRLTISAKGDRPKDEEHSLSISASKPEVKLPDTVKHEKSSRIKTPSAAIWETRSPETVNVGSSSKMFLYGLLILGLLGGLLASIYYYMNRPLTPVYDGADTTASTAPPITEPGPPSNANITESPEQNLAGMDTPPPPREMKQPPDTEFFENTKAGLKGDLLRSYRGFKFYYPKNWKKAETSTAFVDVASRTESGLPKEQMVVTYYNSKGTLKEDLKDFPKLVADTNKKFSKSLTNYKFISSGETLLGKRWKAYEMKFQSSGKAANGQEITLWGRTLFIPAARLGTKYGIAITMLASSLAPDIKSADDVGNKGDLAFILDYFEPSQSE